MNIKKIISTRYLAYSLIALTVILLIFIPFRIPYSITAIGKVLPDREWMIVRLSDGSITSQLINHSQNLTEEVTVIQAQRGDAMHFKINTPARGNDLVKAGDSVAAVISPDLEQSLVQLQGQLTQARSSLRFHASGEKPSLIEEAREQARQARIQVEAQERVVKRLKELLNKSLVSSQEFELAHANLTLLEVNTAIAGARLTAMQTGAKPEQVALVQSQITALENEIEAVSRKAAGYVLRSPISGIRLYTASLDTLLTVATQDSFFVAMLVEGRDRMLLSKGLPVECTSTDGMNPVAARIVRIDRSTQYLGTEPLHVITAAVQPSLWLEPGTLVNCRIRCRPLTKRQLLQRFLR